jgi:hypothetical protein
VTRQGKVKAIPVIGMTLEGNEKDAIVTYAASACRDKLSDVFFNRMLRRVSLGQHVLKVI